MLSRLISRHKIVLARYRVHVQKAALTGDWRHVHILEAQLERLERRILEASTDIIRELYGKLNYVTQVAQGRPYAGDAVLGEIQRLRQVRAGSAPTTH